MTAPSLVSVDRPWSAMHGQTQHCLGTVTEPPAHRRASPEHEVHSCVFFVSSVDCEPAGIAHGELFGDVQPTSTFIDVSRLLVPGQFVELESIVVHASYGGL